MAATSRLQQAAGRATSPRTWPAWWSWRKASGHTRGRSTLTRLTTRESTGTRTTVPSTWTGWRRTYEGGMQGLQERKVVMKIDGIRPTCTSLPEKESGAKKKTIFLFLHNLNNNPRLCMFARLYIFNTYVLFGTSNFKREISWIFESTHLSGAEMKNADTRYHPCHPSLCGQKTSTQILYSFWSGSLCLIPADVFLFFCILKSLAHIWKHPDCDRGIEKGIV